MAYKLSLLVPHMDDEFPVDFCARLAIRNFRSASAFAADMGFALRALRRNREDAMTRLAEVSGVPLLSLHNTTLRRAGERYFLGDQTLEKGSLRRGYFAVCPDCLVEDAQTFPLPPAAAMRHRSHWMAASISVCMKHHVVLTNVGARACKNSHRDWSHIAPSLVSQLPQIKKESVHRAPSEFETYLFDRLNGKKPGYWLDGLDFFAVERTARMFGLVAFADPNAHSAQLTNAQLSAVNNTGFQIIRDGASGINEFLSKVKREYHREGRPKGKRSYTPASLYGRIYTRLYITAHIPELAPVREIVADHILSNFPVGPGELILQKPVIERRVHSIFTLSKQFGVIGARVAGVLTTGGLLPSPGWDDHDAVVDAAKAEALMQTAMTGISQASAEQHLNIDKRSMEKLIENRLIPRHKQSTSGRGYRFFKSELDQFLGRLLEGAVPVAPDAIGGYLNIRRASPFTRCAVARIVELILDRKLRKIGYLIDAVGFDSILVDPGEIKGLFGKPTVPGFTAVEVAAQLRTTPKVIRELAKRKLLEAIHAKNRMSGGMSMRFTQSAIDRFNAEFVSLFHLAREACRRTDRVKRGLEAKGVLPAWETDGLIVTFYRRSDLASL